MASQAPPPETVPKELVLKPCRPEYHGCHFRINHSLAETTLVIVFDGETHRRFSSVRIVLCCDIVWMPDVWTVRPLTPATRDPHGSEDHIHLAPPSDPTLPQLTIQFEVSPRMGSSIYCDIVLTSSVDKSPQLGSRSVCIISESSYPMTSNILSSAIVVTRAVRVNSSGGARPGTTINCLPIELLLKIFEDAHSCACQWQNDLLSFAQVCRQWSDCAMKLLFSRLESPEWKEGVLYHTDQTLDPWAFAEALNETPTLGLGVQNLNVDQYNGLLRCCFHQPQPKSLDFLQALLVILRTTRNLRRLHLVLGSQAHSSFLALPKLPHLRALSIKHAVYGSWLLHDMQHSINAFQLACCMTQWSGLTSLTVEDLRPGNIGMARIFLRQPTCALTQLCIRNSTISDKDLLYLTASSAKTLTRVTLDHTRGIAGDGLRNFLDSISGNVNSLTIWNVRGLECSPDPGEDRALDHVVDKMRYLRELNIRGDVASQHMLRRRSDMFARSGGSGVPVVRLSLQSVPGITKCTGQEWPGWEVVEVC